MSEGLFMRLRPTLDEIPRLAGAVEAYGGANDLPPAIVFNLNLVLDELVTNIVSYGFDDRASAAIEVTLRRDGGTVKVELRDNGKPFNPFDDAPPPDLDSDVEDRPIGGLGVHLVRTLMDEIDYFRLDGFNCVTLSKALSP